MSYRSETKFKSEKASKGFFPEDSMIRKVNSEGVVLMGGGRAILLQLAHPFVAAGVEDHSNFKDEILQRLFRTIQFKHNLIFEDQETASHSLRVFHEMHRNMRGRLGTRSGNFPEDTPYSGADAEAKLWVHATFIETCIKMYEIFIRPLNNRERADYYKDSMIEARLLGIPEEILPKSFESFSEYFQDMLESDTLAITPTAYRLGREVLYPNVGLLQRLTSRLLRFVTAGTISERFRRGYGLQWGAGQQRMLDILKTTIRTLRPVTPKSVWQSPLQGGKMTRFLLWGWQ